MSVVSGLYISLVDYNRDDIRALWEDVSLKYSICISSLTPIPSVSIRQAKDPFVSDVQYIAYSKLRLDERGRLNIRNLGLGVGNFWVTYTLHR